MSSWFSKLFGPNVRRRAAERLLDAITVQARLPAFYESLDVPDTLDGRFDMMALHGAIVFPMLRRKGREGEVLAQDTTDLMFYSFDDAIRSMGVGDNGVPRRVKAMGKAYIGRAIAYDTALKARDTAALKDALLRNVYRGEAPSPDALDSLTAYVQAAADRLAAQPLSDLQAPNLNFGAPQLLAAT